MPMAMQLDPYQSRYQCKGAVVELDDLLMQRHAAKTLEYVAHSRSIAGISGLHLSKMRGRGIDFEEFRPYQQGDDIRDGDIDTDHLFQRCPGRAFFIEAPLAAQIEVQPAAVSGHDGDRLSRDIQNGDPQPIGKLRRPGDSS